ncbi:MAG TPA: DUF962 domain-containing protein [Solimonas sp.]|nr:DUF962 domain-containing protein [Solimonas sp.]
MQFNSFAEFYPYYLGEHSDRRCRRLHVVGTLLMLALALFGLLTLNPWVLPLLPLLGYGFAWVGHFGFEKNRPATFRHPLYSLRGDFAMLRDVLGGRIPF